MKRTVFLSIIVALALSLLLLPTALGAESDFTIFNGELRHYNGPGGDVVIPEGVVRCDSNLFYDNDTVTSVTIPASMTDVDWQMCYGCPSLQNIYVAPENSVYTAWNGVLFNADMTEIICCPAGKSYATIPNGVTKIREFGFAKCANLSGVTLPTSLTEIGYAAFANCTGLVSIDVSANVRTVGNGAFEGCKKLTYLRIQEGVTQIGDSVFRYCDSLKEVVLPDSVQTLGSGVFKDCKALKSVTLPKNLTEIRNATFSGCRELTELELPAGVTDISHFAFSDCVKLERVNIPSGVTSIGNYAFENCRSLGDLALPEGLLSVGIRSFSNCNALTSVTIPGSIGSISGEVFYGCGKLEKMIFAPGMREIGEAVFNGCSALTSVILPDTLTQVTASAFTNSAVTDVYYAGSRREWALVEGAEYIGSKVAVHVDRTGPIPLTRAMFTIDIEPETYTGAPRSKTIVGRDGDKVLVENEDYDVAYRNNTDVGAGVITITGLHLYEGTVKEAFEIVPASLSREMFQWGSNRELTYTGEPLTRPIYCPRGLLKDTDYTVTYQDNINAGTAKAVVRGKGNYTGTVEYTFEIKPKALTQAMLSVDTQREIYTGAPITKTVTGLDEERTLIPGEDFTVAYEKNTNLGTATITVSGQGNYQGSYKYEFPIRSTSPRDSEFSFSDGVLIDFRGSGDVEIPEGVFVISNFAFVNEAVTSLTIPASVKEIKSQAFVSCPTLSSVEVAQGNGAYSSQDGVLFNKDKSELIFCPPGKPGAYTVPDTVVTIRPLAFQYCRELTEVIVPEGVTTIGQNAFFCCPELTRVILPKSLTALGSYPFADSEKLTDIYYAGSEEDWNRVQGVSEVHLQEWMTLHYYYGKFQAASGQLQGESRSLDWASTGSGAVFVDGALPADELVWLACYDYQGRMVSLERIAADHRTAQMLFGCARAKLFWLDGALRPMSSSALVWELATV